MSLRFVINDASSGAKRYFGELRLAPSRPQRRRGPALVDADRPMAECLAS